MKKIDTESEEIDETRYRNFMLLFLSSIYQYIDDFNYLSAIELELELSKFVCSNSYDQVFKRYYNTIVKYITYKSLK